MGHLHFRSTVKRRLICLALRAINLPRLEQTTRGAAWDVPRRNTFGPDNWSCDERDLALSHRLSFSNRFAERRLTS